VSKGRSLQGGVKLKSTCVGERSGLHNVRHHPVLGHGRIRVAAARCLAPLTPPLFLLLSAAARARRLALSLARPCLFCVRHRLEPCAEYGCVVRTEAVQAQALLPPSAGHVHSGAGSGAGTVATRACGRDRARGRATHRAAVSIAASYSRQRWLAAGRGEPTLKVDAEPPTLWNPQHSAHVSLKRFAALRAHAPRTPPHQSKS
jgi:hypothetical protein